MNESIREKHKKNLLVLSSPSGGGKTTVARFLTGKYPEIGFSVSATTRNKRPNETHGKDYYFYSREEFLAMAERGEFVEYEEIYGNLYGTLHSEIDNAVGNNEILLFDVDVKGALSLKNAYPEQTLTIFLAPPSEKVLEERLAARSTESADEVRKRMERTSMELALKDKFDWCIVNEELARTLESAEKIFIDNILGED